MPCWFQHSTCGSPLPSCPCVQERLHLQHAALVVERLRHQHQLPGGFQQPKEPVMEQTAVSHGRRGVLAPLPLPPTTRCPVPSSELALSAAAASSLERAVLLTPASAPGSTMAPHRTEASLQAAARNFQGIGSCPVLVPGTTERDMYLQQTHDAHQCLGDTCSPGAAGDPTEQPKLSTGHVPEHLESAQGETQPSPKPSRPSR